jgi:hypothetical protein
MNQNIPKWVQNIYHFGPIFETIFGPQNDIKKSLQSAPKTSKMAKKSGIRFHRFFPKILGPKQG